MLSQIQKGYASSFINFKRFFSATAAQGGKLTDDQLFEVANKVIEEKVRPFVQSHHGHVSLKGVKDGFLLITLAGNCNDCENKSDTCLNGILEMVQNELPEVAGIKEKID